jgi:sortase A
VLQSHQQAVLSTESTTGHCSVEIDLLKIRNKTLRLLERSLLVAGVILVAVYASAFLHQVISSRLALWQFEKAQVTAREKGSSAAIPSKSEGGVDVSLWAEKRIQAYRASLLSKTDAPLAVLEIAKLQIRVPVFDGTDDLTLNRGVGRIIGTARPGESGNIGIAGHRDGFFRGLKDISVGDEVDLMVTTEKVRYVVDQIEIVSPTDVRVLQPRSMPSLTLVTCYPFYFVGDAPQRFIVHASIASGTPVHSTGTQSNLTSRVTEKQIRRTQNEFTSVNTNHSSQITCSGSRYRLPGRQRTYERTGTDANHNKAGNDQASHG